MSPGFDEAFGRVKELVADFRANEKFYLSPAYQEQEARHDFIDKFWLALGWDVNHETQKNPFEQEVKVERKEHGFSQRRADYAFYLAPNFRGVKFYVEAKKPHGDIATADNYFQTIRYVWSSSTPVAILHDFEQFEIDYCMAHELFTAYRRCAYQRAEFQEKVIALVMDDAKTILKDDLAIISLAKTWKEKYEKLRNELTAVDPQRKSSAQWVFMELLEDMCPRLPDMLGAIKDIVMKRGFDEIVADEFREVLKRLPPAQSSQR